ncbi:MAG: FecR domain-containing protein [Planctomycetota bacterium]|jgi:anti-sigma factor RsiW
MEQRIQHLVTEYLDGELDQRQARELADHLESNESDRKEFLELAAQARVLSVLLAPETSDPERDIAARVIAELRARKDASRFVAAVVRRVPKRRRRARAAPRHRTGRTAFPWVVGAIAALLLVAVALSLIETQRRTDTVVRRPPAPKAVRVRIASIGATEGALERTNAGADGWQEARAGTELAAGDRVRTQDSRGRIDFGSGSALYVNRATEVMFREEAPRIPRELLMVRGEVYVETAPQDKGFLVETPHGRARDDGARFALKVEPESTTVVAAEGKVRVSTAAGVVELGAEEEVLLASNLPSQGRARKARDVGKRLEWTEQLSPPGRSRSETVPVVESFTLMNADTDQPVAGFDPLPDGATLDLAKLPTRRLNIRANIVPAQVGTVRFRLNGKEKPKEEFAPYSLEGDTEGDYNPWTPRAGTYTLTATPYASGRAKGKTGRPLTITFSVVGGKRIR